MNKQISPAISDETPLSMMQEMNINGNNMVSITVVYNLYHVFRLVFYYNVFIVLLIKVYWQVSYSHEIFSDYKFLFHKKMKSMGVTIKINSR